MVSVIIPTYNRAGVLGRSIKSVLNQTYKDLELIVVDDGSTDNTEEIVEEFSHKDSRVIYAKLPENQGACVARNVGIDMAKGEYIAFQDSDSEWLPEKLEIQISCLNKYGADICVCGIKAYSLDGKHQYAPVNYKDDESRFLSHGDVCEKHGVATSALIAKSRVFSDCRFDPKVKRQQDWEWAIRASKDNKVWLENRVLLYDYKQEDSITNTGLRIWIGAREYILKKHEETFLQYPEYYIKQLQRIGSGKAILGLDDREEYRRICQIRGSLMDYLKYFISIVGLRQKYYKIKHSKRKP